MAIIDDEDIQVQLPVDGINVDQIPDDLDEIKYDALVIIRGKLVTVLDSSIIDTWTTPALTPPEIRACAGRLAAANIYRLRYGQGSFQDPEYAQVKYNEAMQMLQDIVDGEIDLTGVDVDVATQFSSDFFEPNDDSTDTPKFTMAGRF